MKIEDLETGLSLKQGIEGLESLKVLFGLNEELYTSNPNKFREVLIKNQDKISDNALEFIGKGILDWFNTLIKEREKELEEL